MFAPNPYPMPQIGELEVKIVKIVLEAVLKAAQVVGKSVIELAKNMEAFFKEIGVLDADTDLDKLSNKAFVAEEDHDIRSENFETYEDYRAAVDAIDVSEERTAKITDDERGMQAFRLLAEAAITRLGSPLTQGIMLAVLHHADFFQNGKLGALGRGLGSNLQAVEAVAGYINGKEQSTEQSDLAFDQLLAAEKAAKPEITGEDAMKNIMALRDQTGM